MSFSRRKALAITAAAPVALAMASPAKAATHEVIVKNFKFIPDQLTIAAGDTIRFSNISGHHTATALDGSFDTGRMNKGQAVEVTFPTKGTFPYKCIYHSRMKATLTVA